MDVSIQTICNRRQLLPLLGYRFAGKRDIGDLSAVRPQNLEDVWGSALFAELTPSRILKCFSAFSLI